MTEVNLTGLHLGVATASTQIEGGSCPSNWHKYSQLGNIKDHTSAEVATMHYQKYQEDIDLMYQMGIKHYRMSLEWAKIQPRKDYFNEEVIKHYHDEMQYLKDKGISICLTLYHFSHPLWFDDMNGFENKENIIYFLKYVKKIIEEFHPYVSSYITLNEPNMYALNTYLFKEWFNYRPSLLRTINVLNHFIAIHIKCYELIHRCLPNAKVSFAINMRAFTPYKNKKIHKLGTKLLDHLYQMALFKACTFGHFSFPFKNILNVKKGVYSDFISFNYYSQGYVKGLWEHELKESFVNDLGWNIYPKGIVECAQQLYALFPKEIIVSENGTCDKQDQFRCKFIYDHLKEMMESKLPFTHYYHWCFVDNFEWKEGHIPKFGLVENDLETQSRTIKNSGYFYQKIIQEQKISEDTLNRFVRSQSYYQKKELV